MDSDIRVLYDLKQQIEKNRINFKKSPKDRCTISYVEIRLDSVEKLFESFCKRHELLIGKYRVEDLSQTTYFSGGIFDIVSETYLDYKVELKSALSKLTPETPKGLSQTSTSNSSSDNRNVQLPKIKIPIFNGKYSEWLSFKDLFTSLIHSNSSLDDVQRLHYLKTLLSGEAEQLIKHVSITATNYNKCWDLLNDRYSNKRFMSNCILTRLFNQRNVTVENSSALKDLLDTTCDCLHELNNLGVDTTTWDVLVIYIISLKLDVESRKQWELHACSLPEALPTFKNFKEFLEVRFRALEFIEPKSKPHMKSNALRNPRVMHATSVLSCPFCSEAHRLINCKKFASCKVDERRRTVESLHLCFNCLGMNHSVKSCRVSTKCQVCKRKHHSLLHQSTASTSNDVSVATATRSTNVDINSNTSPSQEEVVHNIATHFSRGNIQKQVLLATAIVKAESKNGSFQKLRALLDQGSQASFISEAAVQLLRLKKIHTRSAISGIGKDKGNLISKYMVSVKIQSQVDPNFSTEIHAHVLGTLTAILPERHIYISDWPALQGIALADPEFSLPNKIDLLLGAEVYCHIIKEGLLKAPKGSPVAQDTHLGWVLSGHIDFESQGYHNRIVTMHARIEENSILKKFWEMESDSMLSKSELYTPEEQACENHFIATTCRDDNGRYIVNLPFRPKEYDFGNTKDIAIKRFKYLECKLNKNIEIKSRYSETINEYLKLGHMEKVPNDERDKPGAVYLPHHGVTREDKATTKLRVVFDASSKGTSGVSLNDALMVGPSLQADLRHILMKWRQYPICLAADIVKMYRQVKIARNHTDFQRIMWRTDQTKEIEEYRLTRVTFGTSSAPYLAVKALQQTAVDEGNAYPLAAEKVLNDFYVDDLLTGCESETEAIQLYNEMNELLSKGGFPLQKWTSNKEGLLFKFKEENGRDLELKNDNITKVLGLTWNRKTDEFSYTVQLTPPSQPVTKRKVISVISRLYDPLGWLSPFIIKSKIFIQKLWLAGLSWDDEIQPHLLKEWYSYCNELPSITNFYLPRWTQKRSNDNVVELHGFCDASNVAYAAVIYIRTINSKGEVHSNLVTAKTKVAPINQVSIPRLELCGAVLLAKLLTEVATVLKISKSNLHAWTDSTVVLSWLSDHPSRWKPFVANRTSEIISMLDNTQWSHVKSASNPADCASRGLTPSQLIHNQLWKRGPEWLVQPIIDYPKRNTEVIQLEKRNMKVHSVTIDNSFIDELFSKFSSLRKLIRVTAFCRRFINIIKKQGVDKIKPASYLTAAEFRDTLDELLRQCQRQHFSQEIQALTNKSRMPSNSKLISLNPFLDSKGLLRVGGRIHKSQLSENEKHPIVLPHESQLAQLVVLDAHEKTFHGGPQLMLSYLLTKYWIVRAKTLIRTQVHRCVTCTRYRAQSQHQIMGQLPSCRVTPAKPFLQSGVDYAGPINIRISKGRGNKSYKGYICLFVCMATRAVHLEVVSDMTSQSFLAAFKRFVSRRGCCSDLWSDNGTTFVGAAKEIRHLFASEKSSLVKDIASVLANNGTEWHFIPPHSPNFGGLWEAGIKSTKYHLKRVIGDSTLTFEELSTVLSQIEACLNSRPISKASDDSDDPIPLTPGHFLVGQPLILPPDHNHEQDRTIKLNPLRRWQLTQRMVQGFWKRWSREYLTSFFQRHKWAKTAREPTVGEIVLVMEDNLPPAKWLYGRVVQLHPGSDSITRVVTVRCKDSFIKRPISKLCLLPKDLYN